MFESNCCVYPEVLTEGVRPTSKFPRVDQYKKFPHKHLPMDGIVVALIVLPIMLSFVSWVRFFIEDRDARIDGCDLKVPMKLRRLS